MDQLWGVLGRGCVDSAFLTNLVSAVVEKKVGPFPEPEDDGTKLTSFKKVLTDHDFRPSIWDVAELNRIFFIIKFWLNESPPEHLTKEWTKLNGSIPFALPPEEMWRLLGLCSIDPQFADRYFAEPERVAQLVLTPPKFKLAPNETAALINFFRETILKDVLLKIHERCWIPPKKKVLVEFLREAAARLEAEALPRPQCLPAFETPPGAGMVSYRHVAPAIVELLASKLSAPSPLPEDLDFKARR